MLYIQPSTRPRINISQVLAGRFLFFICFLFYCVSSSRSFFSVFMCVFDWKCKSLKRLGENMFKLKKHKKKQEEINKNNYKHK